jgi:hypothetical protein
MLLLFLLGRDHFAALVVAAVRADVVRQHGLIALAAILNGDGSQVLVTSPLPLAGVRCPSLGYCHEIAFLCLTSVNKMFHQHSIRKTIQIVLLSRPLLC